jgi:hypothetical protein
MLSIFTVALLMNLPADRAKNALVLKYGEAQRPRIERGVDQVAQFWREEDGDAAAFEQFATANFAGDPQTLDALFERMEFVFESVDGYFTAMSRDLGRQVDLDIGPIYTFDEMLNAWSPAAHVDDDLFQNKIAFVVLLNFPLTTLEQRLSEGDHWTRRQWAEARLAQRFSRRVPASVSQEMSRARAAAAQYVSTYNVYVDGKRLLAHWNLRDEIKAVYAEGEAGLPRQRKIQRVMERIVDDTVPAEVIDNPRADWDPFTSKATGRGRRYDIILADFHAAQLVDKYSPTAPTLIDRRFNENRELPEARVKAMLEQIVGSPLVPRVVRLIETRLGRPLEPFDVWYNGFRANSTYTDAQLSELTRKKYPTADAYKADMRRMFEQLGFPADRARMLADNIVVDPARGSGHAMSAGRREDHPHLRTRVAKDGMDYKGYNIAVHEMGHNVEQTFSLNSIDYVSLSGVPNTAFTEALAFVFQNRDMELLGLAKPNAESEALKTLNEFWGTYEIAGVALVDMGMWHWLYDHPKATSAELNAATVQIAKDVWNRWYAPVFHHRDVTLLGVYAHMVDEFLYLPDYPIGHMIASQIEQQMEKAGNVGTEFERMAKMGNVTPDLWMKNATGAPVGPEALLRATERALETVK